MPCSSSINKTQNPTPDMDHSVQPAVELLDDYWFFHNPLKTKNRMFRSASDPYPSSNNMEQVFAQIGNVAKDDVVNNNNNSNLQRAPSLPISIGRDRKNLRRAPSLPMSIGRDRKIEDKELPISIGRDRKIEDKQRTRRSNKLKRHSSLCSPIVVPLRRAYRSGAVTSPGIPKHLVRQESMATKETTSPGIPKHLVRQESMATKETTSPGIPKHLVRQESMATKETKLRMPRSASQNSLKSPRELEIEEVQGFNDLGFDFTKIDINSSVADLIPGLQSKKPDDWDEAKVERPYLSEAWLVHRFKPVVPDWIHSGSKTNMKRQLKYWARAVATNVRQEC